MKNERITPQKSLEFVTEILRQAMLAHGVDEDSVMNVYSSILFDTGARNADRLRAIEIFTKLAGLNAPEVKKIELKGVNIGVETPDDLEL